jgi:hypothetical protein
MERIQLHEIPVVEIIDWRGYAENNGEAVDPANLHHVQIDVRFINANQAIRGCQIGHDRDNDRPILGPLGQDMNRDVYLDARSLTIRDALNKLIEIENINANLTPVVTEIHESSFAELCPDRYGDPELTIENGRVMNRDDELLISDYLLDLPFTHLHDLHEIVSLDINLL